MKRTFNFGKINYRYPDSWVNKVTVDVEYEERDGEIVFSVSGSIWNPSGTDIETGGQILDTIANYVDNPVFMEIHRLWKLYHLNNMHPECEHQRELGWNEIAKRSVNIYHYHMTRDALKKQNEAKNKALAALKNGETFTPTKEDTFYANLSYSLKSSTESLPDNLKDLYEPDTGWNGYIETKTLGWLHESDHPDGILGKACPVCGYKYGTGWKYSPIPKEDEEIIVKLVKEGTLRVLCMLEKLY